LTQEEIKTLSTNPDPQTPSHHQVDPRIIKAYLMGESIPTAQVENWKGTMLSFILHYQDSEGIETDSIRNPPRPVK
jgi:hypothetical protein